MCAIWARRHRVDHQRARLACAETAPEIHALAELGEQVLNASDDSRSGKLQRVVATSASVAADKNGLENLARR